MLLFVKNLLFTLPVPGTVPFYVPFAIGTTGPGRKRDGKERASLAARVPRQRDRVLKKIVAYEIRWRVRAGRQVNPLLIEFWNALNGGARR